MLCPSHELVYSITKTLHRKRKTNRLKLSDLISVLDLLIIKLKNNCSLYNESIINQTAHMTNTDHNLTVVGKPRNTSPKTNTVRHSFHLERQSSMDSLAKMKYTFLIQLVFQVMLRCNVQLHTTASHHAEEIVT